MSFREHKSRPEFSFRSSLKDRNTDPRNHNLLMTATEETYNFTILLFIPGLFAGHLFLIINTPDL